MQPRVLAVCGISLWESDMHKFMLIVIGALLGLALGFFGRPVVVKTKVEPPAVVIPKLPDTFQVLAASELKTPINLATYKKETSKVDGKDVVKIFLTVKDEAPEGTALQVTFNDNRVLGIVWDSKPMEIPSGYETAVPKEVNWYHRHAKAAITTQGPKTTVTLEK